MLFFELSQRSYKLKNAMNQKFLQYNEKKINAFLIRKANNYIK